MGGFKLREWTRLQHSYNSNGAERGEVGGHSFPRQHSSEAHLGGAMQEASLWTLLKCLEGLLSHGENQRLL